MSRGLLASVQLRDAPSVSLEWSVQRAAGLANVWSRGRFLIWLAFPFAFYLIPVLMGYSWNALGEGHNILNPPEGYSGRLPDRRITVEAWGASVVDVPFHARLQAYLHAHELPLWNPYQGLGQPFAAQGEESPYSPFAIARALLPYALSNYITFGVYYLSAVCMFLFLRGLGLSEKPAIFGGVVFVTSGALSLHVGRPNIADQVSLIPVLFWAAARAMRKRTILAFALFALVAALHLTGGFIQIAMLAALLLAAFCLVYTRSLVVGTRTWLWHSATTLGVFALGNGLLAFYLLPLLEAMVSTFNKNLPFLSLLTPIGFGHVVAFFFPLVLGYSLFQNWSPPPAVPDWDNLYAFTGTAVLLIAACGLVVRRWPSFVLRRMYWFFFLAAVFLTLRYAGLAPARLVDYLPIIGRQSPKHATGLMAFTFIVAAAFALEAVKGWHYRRAIWLGVGICVYFASVIPTLVEGAGFTSTGVVSINTPEAVRSVAATTYLVLLIVGALWLVSVWRDRAPGSLVTLLIVITVAELVTYIPLGNGAFEYLEFRLGLATLLVLAGVLLALGQRWVPGALVALTLAGYAVLISLPGPGLPRQFNVDTPPRFLNWLRSAEGEAYRSFGIPPDHSSIGAVQDLSVVGPLAPREFEQFVRLISDQKTADDYEATTHFMLAGPWSYGLDQYQQVKPILDWAGVRFLVLDSAYFNPGSRQDDQLLLDEDPNVRVAYTDDRVRIVESSSARPKAEFWTHAVIFPNQSVILADYKQHPDSILGPPRLEGSNVPRSAFQAAADAAGPLETAVVEYRPNFVRLRVDAPQSGLVVLKDSYFPGWQAFVNGQSAEVLRVNGLVRGVAIPGRGQFDVTFVYQPDSFVRGLWLAGTIGLLLLASVAYALLTRRRTLPVWALLGGAILTGVLLDQTAQAYFGKSAEASLASLTYRNKAEVLGDARNVTALAVDSPDAARAGSEVRTDNGQTGFFMVDDLAFSPQTGEILRLGKDGTSVRLTGDERQRVRVTNLGAWDSSAQRFEGLDATYVGGKWTLDTSSLAASNPNSNLQQSTATDPIPGFWVSPGDAGYQLTRGQDADGSFVRIEATRAAQYLVLNGQDPLDEVENSPVILRGQIRAHTGGEMRLTLYDVRSNGSPNTSIARASASETTWTTLRVVDRVEHPDAQDNYSLGLYDVQPGDWFEVRELAVFLGEVP